MTVIAPASPLPLLVGLFFMIALQGMTLPTSFTLGISAQNVGAGTASGILGVAVFIFGACTSLVGLAGGDTAVPLGLVSACTGLPPQCSDKLATAKCKSASVVRRPEHDHFWCRERAALLLQISPPH